MPSACRRRGGPSDHQLQDPGHGLPRRGRGRVQDCGRPRPTAAVPRHAGRPVAADRPTSVQVSIHHRYFHSVNISAPLLRIFPVSRVR